VLEARRRELGEEGLERGRQEWTDLIEAVEAERRSGTDPAAPRMQDLARRWMDLVEQMTGGDAGIGSR